MRDPRVVERETPAPLRWPGAAALVAMKAPSIITLMRSWGKFCWQKLWRPYPAAAESTAEARAPGTTPRRARHHVYASTVRLARVVPLDAPSITQGSPIAPAPPSRKRPREAETTSARRQVASASADQPDDMATARRDLLLDIQAKSQKKWADEKIFEVSAPRDGAFIQPTPTHDLTSDRPSKRRPVDRSRFSGTRD